MNRTRVVMVLLGLLVLGVPAGVLWTLPALNPGGCIVQLEFAGSAEVTDELLSECGISSEEVVAALWLDFAFIAAYTALLVVAAGVGMRLFRGSGARAARYAAVSAVAAAVADFVENTALLGALADGEPGWDGGFTVAQAAALVKFVALVLPIVVGVVVLLTLVVRAVWRPTPTVELAEVDSPPGASDPGAPTAWAANYELPARHLTRRYQDRVGVCLSGGGIRSATFAAGAFNALAHHRTEDDAGLLDDAAYLCTVSGGGYFGGALQMLRYCGGRTQGQDKIPVASAYAPGSPELARLRRHGKYIAEGFTEWVGALVVVARNTVLGLGLVYAVLLVSAWLLASAYAAASPWSLPLFVDQPVDPPVGGTTVACAPNFAAGTWLAVAVPLGLAGLAWLLSGIGPTGWRHWSYAFAAGSLALGVAIAVVVVVLPSLVSWVAALPAAAGPEADVSACADAQPLSFGSLAGVGSLTALVAAGTTVWNVLAKQLGSSDGAAGVAGLLGKASFATRFVLTLAVVVALAGLAAIVFAAELSQALVARLGDGWEGSGGAAVAAVVLVLVTIVFDQTRMSLHPFYKRRLATAFAVRRDRDSATATEIDWDSLTTLSDFGTPVAATGDLQKKESMRLVVCAAANTTGHALGAPGRRVVPFVFSSDAVGSPALGYLDTADLEEKVAGFSYDVDVTQTAAIALSGAAFASAMGKASGPFNAVIALTNARLGAWLPNPRYHARRSTAEESGLAATENPLPRRRRLQYYLREITGSYSPDARFVYVTDGGHYENLGLVELLRRRCSLIYCVDASGDRSLAHTLAQAAALAYEELGVTVSVDGMSLAVGASGDFGLANDDLTALEARLGGKCVVEATATYPEFLRDTAAEAAQGEAPTPSPARVIIGKARLTAGMLKTDANYDLLAHAAANPDFPNDSTADQWFDADQFDAYLRLGQVVGRDMAQLSTGSETAPAERAGRDATERP